MFESVKFSPTHRSFECVITQNDNVERKKHNIMRKRSERNNINGIYNEREIPTNNHNSVTEHIVSRGKMVLKIIQSKETLVLTGTFS